MRDPPRFGPWQFRSVQELRHRLNSPSQDANVSVRRGYKQTSSFSPASLASLTRLHRAPYSSQNSTTGSVKMKTGYAQKNAITRREPGVTCPQRRGRKLVHGAEGVCGHQFVTELCILRGCRNIGVRLLEETQSGNRAEHAAIQAQGVTPEERASLAES